MTWKFSKPTSTTKAPKVCKAPPPPPTKKCTAQLTIDPPPYHPGDTVNGEAVATDLSLPLTHQFPAYITSEIGATSFQPALPNGTPTPWSVALPNDIPTPATNKIRLFVECDPSTLIMVTLTITITAP